MSRMLICFPNLTCPKTDMLEPNLAVARMLKVEPRLKQSSTDTLLPRVVVAKTERTLPKRIVARREQAPGASGAQLLYLACKYGFCRYVSIAHSPARGASARGGRFYGFEKRMYIYIYVYVHVDVQPRTSTTNYTICFFCSSPYFGMRII